MCSLMFDNWLFCLPSATREPKSMDDKRGCPLSGLFNFHYFLSRGSRGLPFAPGTFMPCPRKTQFVALTPVVYTSKTWLHAANVYAVHEVMASEDQWPHWSMALCSAVWHLRWFLAANQYLPHVFMFLFQSNRSMMCYWYCYYDTDEVRCNVGIVPRSLGKQVSWNGLTGQPLINVSGGVSTNGHCLFVVVCEALCESGTACWPAKAFLTVLCMCEGMRSQPHDTHMIPV